VDFDGRNFGVRVDNDKKTVTITSTYYVKPGDKFANDAMRAGVSQWNSQKTTMSLGDVEYNVNFDFKVEQANDLIGATDNDYEANSAQSLTGVAWDNLAEKNGVDPEKTGGMCFTVLATGSKQLIFPC
jgi:hypothetical protein